MTPDPTQFVPFDTFPGEVSGPWKIDGAKVRFWAKKTEAENAAVAIGWAKKDVIRVATRFQLGWAIGDGRFGLLSKGWVDARLAEVGS